MQELNDEDFIHYARYVRYGFISTDEQTYLEQRLMSLGYRIEYGCCGTNNLRYTNERHTFISKA